MKNRFTRVLSFLLIVATLCSLLVVFPSAATEKDASVKMFLNRTFNEGWDYNNGMSLSGGGLVPYINHEYDDDYNYNYYMEVGDKSGSLAGGKISMTIPNANIPTTGKTVLSFRLKLHSGDNQDYGTIVSAKTKPGVDYNLLTVNKNQITVLGTALGSVYNDEWIEFEYVMGWADGAERICAVTVNGGGLETSTTLPLTEGMSGASLQYVYFGMSTRVDGSADRGLGLDDVVFYNTAQNVIAASDLNLYGVGTLVKESVAKTIEIYGESTLAPTDYIRKGLTMKVGVNSYMTDVITDSVTGAKKHTKLNIYTAENGDPYGAPVKIDGVVYVPLDLILEYLGLNYALRENSVEISTGGKSSVSITVGSTSASVNNQRVELAGAPGLVSSVIAGVEYKYIVIPLDNVETFFAQGDATNPLYVTYDDMGLIFLTGKKNVWTREANLNDMAALMEKFIFDYDYENQGKGFGQQLYDDIMEYSNFEHPYLFANQDRFNTLRAVWLSNNADSYAHLMSLSDAEKIELGIIGADPEGYNDTLRDWLRKSPTVCVNDPAYIVANGVYDPEDPANHEISSGVNIKSVELMYAGSSSQMILDPEGNYLGMSPALRANTVNHNLPENGGKYEDGYDAGGRFDTGEITGSLSSWSWSYQITRDLRYAQLAYDHYCIIGDTSIWEHWGPTHFLNPADATTTIAMAYDWLCPAWDALCAQGVARPVARTEVYAKVFLELDGATRYVSEAPNATAVPTVLEVPSFPDQTTYNRKHPCDVIFNQGVYEGWLSQIKDMTDHPSVRCLGGFEWKSNKDNWNAVCTKGMALGGMMTLEYADFRAETIELFDEMMYWFFVNGLDEYAPDGAYYESASYWAYGTNAVFQLAAAYVGATGRDYGIMDCYGLDRTCYFAANVESSDAMIWSYNDCGGGGSGPATGGMDTQWFLWVGSYIGDPGIIEHRIYQLENGLKSVSRWDMFWYKESYSGVDEIKLPLSYYMEGLNGYCGAYSVRSSWEKGAMTMAVIGGTNAVAHADVDAGAFMYWNKGLGWIWDLGADNYNLTSFFGAGYGSNGTLPNRFRYYRHGAEGNNVVVLASHQDILPFGQRVKGKAPLQRQYADDNGAFAIFEMLDIYSADPELNGTASPLVKTAIRGVMATDDYNTVVLQDEILADKMETFYWFAHFSNVQIKVAFSENGRVCYMTQQARKADPETGEKPYHVLRLTIVSPDSADKFYVTSAGDDGMVFDATFRYGTHQNYPDQKESSRDAASRLCIKRANKTNFKVAVVFEMLPAGFYNPRNGEVDIAGGQDTYPCSYKWTDMFAWETQAAPEYNFDNNGSTEQEGVNEVLSPTDLTVYSNIVKKYENSGTVYTTDYFNMFAAVSRVKRVWDRWEGQDMIKPFESGYQHCEEYIRACNRIQKQVNQTSTAAVKIATLFAGVR